MPVLLRFKIWETPFAAKSVTWPALHVFSILGKVAFQKGQIIIEDEPVITGDKLDMVKLTLAGTLCVI